MPTSTSISSLDILKIYYSIKSTPCLIIIIITFIMIAIIHG